MRGDTPRIKLARQALNAHKAALATNPNKDQVQRQIQAAKDRLAQEIIREKLAR